MAIIYISTDEQVSYERTADLLDEYNAIWCPPPELRHWNGTPPSERETTVLAHRGANYTLLGAGVTRPNPRRLFNTNLLWTEADVPGVRERAQQLGYAGPLNMSFLILDNVQPARLGIGQDVAYSLDALNPGLNVVPEQLARRLIEMIKAPTRPPTVREARGRQGIL